MPKSKLPHYPAGRSHNVSADVDPIVPGKITGAFELFGPSWKAFKLNGWTFVLGAIVPLLIFIAPILITLLTLYHNSPSDITPGHSASTTVINVISVLAGILGVVAIAAFFVPYMYLLKLQSARGVKMILRTTLKQSLPFFWRMIGLYMLRGILIFGGFVLLIVPGLFMWKKYMLAPFYLVDKNCSISESMSSCATSSKQFSDAIWGMIGVYIVIQLAGLVPLLGIVATPVLSIVYCCAQAIRYLEVEAASG